MPDTQAYVSRELFNELKADYAELKSEFVEYKKEQSENRKLLYGRIEALETDRGRTEEQYKQIQKSIEDLGKQQKELVDALNDLKQKPAKRWDSVVSNGISAVVGGAVGVAISKIFGGS